MKTKSQLLSNLLIGHADNGHSGVTVFRFDDICRCSYVIPGAAPATRETQLLEADASVDEIHALCFTGGSAFGLGVADGVMDFLHARQEGVRTRAGVVPIVPTAAIYDLHPEKRYIPTAKLAYQACEHAHADNWQMGAIGAATGATVGKYMGSSMNGGFGIARAQLDDVVMVACVVVNALGDIVDRQHDIIAGAQDEAGEFIGIERAIQSSQAELPIEPSSNTTLAALFTNVNLSKAHLARLAKAAMPGMARSIRPVFTALDGDIIFACSLGNLSADELCFSELAADTLQQAIINSVSSV